MKIIVDKMPEHPSECLFSNWNNKSIGWFCILYNCKHTPELLYLANHECDIARCPYLQEERSLNT